MRSLNLVEKLLLNKTPSPPDGGIRPGVVVRVSVDWVIASELSWIGMERTYNDLGRPKLIRPERFWIAADHRVDPRNMHEERIQKILAHTKRIAEEYPEIEYQPPNQTILHTEFYRERVQPGQIVLGSDSHTTSHGGLGAFAVGLGAVDVCIPLLCGETWFVVPEVIRINFVGQPAPGIGGKDVILYVLGQLKRNTVAAQRAVELGGPGAIHLSSDARFAICNMCTEFGALAGVFVPDEHAVEYLGKRKVKKHTTEATYMQPDPGAEYSGTFEINLDNVSPLVALFPAPDDVHTAEEIEMAGQLDHLDGCFIGACTTTEEDHILAALVLEAGMSKGLKPSVKGHRKVTMGSVQTLKNLEAMGLNDIFRRAGFDIEPPGCSYCTGGAWAKAAPGEIWLSSQNRNFKNRMGRGAIGNLASSTTVAASSFEMSLKDPRSLLAAVDMKRYDQLRGFRSRDMAKPTYLEPACHEEEIEAGEKIISSMSGEISGKPLRLGADIDTDAIIAVAFTHSPLDVGKHCFEIFAPEARARISEGYNIVVADRNFGCGSSREEAVLALVQAGVQAVIAPSYAYIFQRNCPNLSLLNIKLDDPEFYAYVDREPEAPIAIHIAARSIQVGPLSFAFSLSPLQVFFLMQGGVASAYAKHGSKLFSKSTSAGRVQAESATAW